MHLTPNQTEVLKVVAAGNDDGSQTDLDEIIERVSYRPSKAAIQFTIRSLIGHGLIEKVGSEKRRDRKRVLIGITDLGRHFAAAASRRPGFVTTEVEEEVFAEIAEILE